LKISTSEDGDMIADVVLFQWVSKQLLK